MIASCWSRAILCLQLWKTSLYPQYFSFAVLLSQKCFSRKSCQSLTELSFMILPATVTWHWELSVAGIALYDGSCGSPWRVPSAYNGGLSYYTQIPPVVTVVPSDPWCSCSWFDDTKPLCWSAAPSDYPSLGEQILNVCNVYWHRKEPLLKINRSMLCHGQWWYCQAHPVYRLHVQHTFVLAQER